MLQSVTREETVRRKSDFPQHMPKSDRNPMDRLQGKRICVAIDDADFDRMQSLYTDFVANTVPTQSITIMSWSTLLQQLPKLDVDIMLILSPRAVGGSLEEFEAALKAHRDNNPSSAVVMNNLHSPLSMETSALRMMRNHGLIDHVEEGFAVPKALLLACANALKADPANEANI